MGGSKKERFSEDEMSGYDGYSMSNRARQAYADGKMPLSKIKKKDLEDHGIDATVADFKRAVRAGLIVPSEWHHTSKHYNETDFYDLVAIAEEIKGGDIDLRDLHDPSLVAERKKRESEQDDMYRRNREKFLAEHIWNPFPPSPTRRPNWAGDVVPMKVSCKDCSRGGNVKDIGNPAEGTLCSDVIAKRKARYKARVAREEFEQEKPRSSMGKTRRGRF